jgi:hypothetical protein
MWKKKKIREVQWILRLDELKESHTKKHYDQREGLDSSERGDLSHRWDSQ